MDFDFSKPAESLEKVPEQFRGLYGETDEGNYALRSDDPAVKGAVEAILGLNKSLKASRAEAKQKSKQAVDLSPLKDFGESPDEIASAIQAKIEELESQVAGGKKAKIDIDKIKQDLAKGHVKEIEGKDKRITALQSQLYTLLVETAARSAIKKNKGDEDLLLPFVKQHIRPVEEDGKFEVFVVDESGDRRYSGTTGTHMTIEELVSEMKANDRYGKLFESEAPRGSGQVPGSAGVNSRASARTQDLSSVDKIKLGLAQQQKR